MSFAHSKSCFCLMIKAHLGKRYQLWRWVIVEKIGMMAGSRHPDRFAFIFCPSVAFSMVAKI